MNSITIDTKKFLDELKIIVSALIISTERRSMLLNEIITALINSELDDGYSEFDNLLNVDPCENVNTSLNSIQDAYFKSSLKIEVFKMAMTSNTLALTDKCESYFYICETLKSKGIL